TCRRPTKCPAGTDRVPAAAPAPPAPAPAAPAPAAPPAFTKAPATPAPPVTSVSLDPAASLRSVSIAASVLSCFSAHPELGATQVARELGVAKSTACRML